jgi:hypothetical protein
MTASPSPLAADASSAAVHTSSVRAPSAPINSQTHCSSQPLEYRCSFIAFVAVAETA